MDINTKQKTEIKLTNIFEQQRPILDVEFFDHQRLFFILYNNLNFTIFNYEKYKMGELRNEGNHYERLCKTKTQYFNFKKYLNYISIPELEKLKFNQQSILKIQSRDLIMLNFTYFSDRIVTFDTVNCTIKYNIYINPQNFSFLIPSNTFQSFNIFNQVCKFLKLHKLIQVPVLS